MEGDLLFSDLHIMGGWVGGRAGGTRRARGVYVSHTCAQLHVHGGQSGHVVAEGAAVVVSTRGFDVRQFIDLTGIL